MCFLIFLIYSDGKTAAFQLDFPNQTPAASGCATQAPSVLASPYNLIYRSRSFTATSPQISLSRPPPPPLSPPAPGRLNPPPPPHPPPYICPCCPLPLPPFCSFRLWLWSRLPASGCGVLPKARCVLHMAYGPQMPDVVMRYAV